MTTMNGLSAMTQLQLLSPHSQKDPRPSTLRTRSTGGLPNTKLSDRGNEFDHVDIPSPILNPLHSGLDGLSESLAQLIKQRRHSEANIDDKHEEPHQSLRQYDVNQENSGAFRSTDPPHFIALHDVNVNAPSPSSSSRPLSPSPRVTSTPSSGPSTTRTSMYSSQKLSAPQMAEVAARTGNAKVMTSQLPTSGTGTTRQSFSSSSSNAAAGPSAMTMLRKASAEQPQASTSSSRAQSPFESGASTPRMMLQSGKAKPQVLETHRLQLQTHTATGRRMINQYIIETELGRGVHGKVRLARDTETGERVAVKIVEREGKKRLGGGLTWNNKLGRGPASIPKNKSEETAKVSEVEGPSGTPKARFSDVEITAKGESSHGDVQDTDQADSITKQEARKRQLWTTDKKVKREIALLKKCAHDNVVQLKEVIDDPSSKKIFMVLEFMEGGEVQWKDERGFPTLTVDEARRTLRDVVLGLEYLHYQGIIHRDIKPANLLWDVNHKVKISDFGVSHFSYALLVASGGLPSSDGDEEKMKDPSLVDDHELAKTAGSPAFFAPELCLAGESMGTNASLASMSTRIIPTKGNEAGDFPWTQQSPNKSVFSKTLGESRKNRPPITKAIDIWALGVTLYCLLFGHVPFTADSEFALFTVIPREDYELPAFMGADRIRIGPRKKRWTALPQWRDEEADVHHESNEDDEAETDLSSLSEEAKLVRDLLDRLLEKDPAKRIKLEEVKKHPWLVRDIADPPLWLSETDPAHLPSVQVSNEEVDGALTGFSRIKQTLKKFQTKLFAGLGVQPVQSVGVDRGDHGLHRKSQLLNGGAPIRRRRSKSTSHAQGAPLVALSHTASPPIKPLTQARGQKASPLAPLPTANDDAKSNHHQISRPHLFFRRRPSVPEVGKNFPIGMSSVTREASRSQPASRPHSPAVDESASSQHAKAHLEKESTGTIDPMENLRRVPSRRPSSLFKRATSRGDFRNSNVSTPKVSSSDLLPLNGTEAADPHILHKDASIASNKVADSNSNNTLPRSSLDSEGGKWSFISASQSGVQYNSTPRQHSVSNRPRSRSKLGDVFRNVLGHHPHAESRNVGVSKMTSKAKTPSLHRKEASMLAAPVVASPWTVTSESAQEGHNNIDFSNGDQHIAAYEDETTPNAIEVDDYDVDLDLSDDDLEEVNRRSQPLLRNDGRGWRLEQDNTSLSSNGQHRQGPESIASEHLTPSVEGGYNLFKPPYGGSSRDPPINQDETYNEDDNNIESYAMTQFHSDEAEALRRASAKVEDDSQHLEMSDRNRSQLRQHHDVLYANQGDHLDESIDGEGGGVDYQSAIGDNSAMTDDQFADADEEGVGKRTEGREPEEEEEDEDDGGVSFQARKRGNS